MPVMGIWEEIDPVITGLKCMETAFKNSVLHEMHIFQCVDVLDGIIYIKKMGTFQIPQTNILSMHRMKTKIY